jgi:PAS domain S-box-containing protein
MKGWPRATGEMAGRIRSHDWSGTSIGPLKTWPQSLRNVVDLTLDSRQPGYIAWGDDLCSMYNDAAIPILGSKHPGGLGLPYRLLFAEIWTEFAPLVAATLRGEAQFFEDRAVALAGRDAQPLSWFTFSFTPLRDDGGRVCGFHCSATETTQRIQAAQATHQTDLAARRASDARYRALFNSIDEGFCVIEMAFDESGTATDYKFLETNPAFEQQTGLSNATGKWMRSLSPLHEQHWFDTYGRVARSGESIRFVQHARALGRWFNVFAFRINSTRRNQVAVLFSDITDRIDADNALRAADRRKDEFLATLAHELRNPLAPLRNGLQIVRRGARTDKSLLPTVDMMDRQLTQLVRLVDDLLDLGRIGSGKLELRREPLSLQQLLTGSIEACRVIIEQHRHDLRVEGDAAHLFVLGDPHRLTQVFTNLLSNSCKYTDPGGRIRVSVSRQGGEAVIRFIDSGIGIPESDMARVFELFSQVLSHRLMHAGGLGIGLSLVRSLVEMHGGTVEASSDGAGLGSTFTVRLPLLAGAPLPVAAPATRPAAEPASRRVVIADDNADAVSTLAQLLRLQGHEVWTASDGIEAVEQASIQHPHAILLDIGMPRLDGIEAARRIRALPGGEQPLIVALTGWGQPADREKTRAAGFDCHLVKPADPDEVLALIERARESRGDAPLHS